MKKKSFIIIIWLGLLCIVPCITILSDEQRFYDGSKVQKTDKEFGNPVSVRAKDRHGGWKLGDFVISDYSDWMTDKSGGDVFLKKLEDKITVSFDLQQNIKELNGEKHLKIANIDRGDMTSPEMKEGVNGIGTLFVEKEDHSGKKSSVKKYANYLKGVSQNADAKVLTLEEGDYHFVLVYAIDDTSLLGDFFNNHQYYRIDYRFKVRNGNAMAFIKDAETGKELKHDSMTKGFIIDTAQSHYLNIQVSKRDKNGDIRKNVPYKNGEVVSEEGDYIISITTDYSNEPTQKIIHVSASEKNITNTHETKSPAKSYEKTVKQNEAKNQDNKDNFTRFLLYFGIVLLGFLVVKIYSKDGD